MSAMIITIPVHEEPEWLAKSPDECPVKSRLEESKKGAPKSVEDMRLAEMYAEKLHQAHLEAVAARAARDVQRTNEAKARRLRQEASARQRLEAKHVATSSSTARLVEAKLAALRERADKRKAVREAVLDARIARQHSLELRAEELAGRCNQAESKRAKAIQATVERNAYSVKKALATAVAVKERTIEESALAGEKLVARLGAAAHRRTTSNGSPSLSGERLRRSVAARREQDMEREAKRVALEQAMFRAAEKRESKINAICAKAEAANAHARAVAEAAEAAGTNKSGARRALFERLNGAEVRRMMSSRSAKAKAPVLIVVDQDKKDGAEPPVDLLARLVVKTPRPTDASARHERAQAARRAALVKVAAKAAAVGVKVARAQAGAKAAKTAREAKIRNTASAAADASALARAARVAFAKKMSARGKAAATRRAAARGISKKGANAKALLTLSMSGRRAAALLAAAKKRDTAVRAADARGRRAVASAAKLARGAVLASREAAVADRRAALLSAAAARAKMSAIRRSVPVKLGSGGTQVCASPVEEAVASKIGEKKAELGSSKASNDEWEMVSNGHSEA